MGLACNQIRLLTLTARKADCEYGISMNSIEKMALTREQSELSREYQSKLSASKIAYYNNGQYYQMNYSYLMGYGAVYESIINGDMPLKSDNSMILCDYMGQVVLSDTYANAITSVLGSSAMDSNGRGGTFSTDKIPEILAAFLPGFSAEQIETVINGDTVSGSASASTVQATTGETTGSATMDTTAGTTSVIQQVVDFYYPIFQAAAANGWTTEYNKDMNRNTDYVSDALTSGTFQLETVESDGNYDPGTSLTYFITSGLVVENTSSEARAEITAWYEAEKAKISEKEDWLDIENQDLSTELEAINTEIESVKSMIDDAVSSVFDWGSS